MQLLAVPTRVGPLYRAWLKAMRPAQMQVAVHIDGGWGIKYVAPKGAIASKGGKAETPPKGTNERVDRDGTDASWQWPSSTVATR